jgi:hypothetical protein
LARLRTIVERSDLIGLKPGLAWLSPRHLGPPHQHEGSALMEAVAFAGTHVSDIGKRLNPGVGRRLARRRSPNVRAA